MVSIFLVLVDLTRHELCKLPASGAATAPKWCGANVMVDRQIIQYKA
jgi:hypothetical protein